MADNRKFDAAKKARFLEELAACGRRAEARAAVSVSKRTVENHLNPTGAYHDEEFSESYEEAMDVYRARLVQEVHRRGVDGVPEPVYYQGARIVEKNGKDAAVLKYSDRMLELLVKRHCPEFRDRSTVDQTVTHQGSIALADLSQLPRSDRDALRPLLERAMARGAERN